MASLAFSFDASLIKKRRHGGPERRDMAGQRQTQVRVRRRHPRQCRRKLGFTAAVSVSASSIRLPAGTSASVRVAADKRADVGGAVRAEVARQQPTLSASRAASKSVWSGVPTSAR